MNQKLIARNWQLEIRQADWLDKREMICYKTQIVSNRSFRLKIGIFRRATDGEERGARAPRLPLRPGKSLALLAKMVFQNEY